MTRLLLVTALLHAEECPATDLRTFEDTSVNVHINGGGFVTAIGFVSPLFKAIARFI